MYSIQDTRYMQYSTIRVISNGNNPTFYAKISDAISLFTNFRTTTIHRFPID